MGRGRRPVHVLDVRGGLFAPVANAVHEILHVGQMLLGIPVFFIDQPVTLGRHEPAAAIEEQNAITAVKLHAVLRLVHGRRAVIVLAAAHRVDVGKARVGVMNLERVRRVAVVLHLVVAADRIDR